MITIGELSLSDIMPESLRADAGCLFCMDAMDPQLRAASRTVDLPAVLDRLDELDGGILDHVARHFDVPTWRDSWDEATKRRMIRACFDIKRRQGTLKAVKDALAVLGASATVTEWWQTEPEGTPHTFSVTVRLSGGTQVTQELQEDIAALIDAAKPVRSHCTFVIEQGWTAGKQAGTEARAMTAATFIGGNAGTGGSNG